MSLVEMVREFMAKFGQPMPKRPSLETPRVSLRLSLLTEELDETINAVESDDLYGAADGLVDLIYVAIGTALEFGIDLEPVFRLVHAANMKKVGGSMRDDGKILKPEGWLAPDIASEIERQIRMSTDGGDDDH